MFGDIADKLRNATISTDNKELYGIAANEIAQGKMDGGLWAKAFADSGGELSKAQATYIRMRVAELIRLRDGFIKQAQLEEKIQKSDATERSQALEVPLVMQPAYPEKKLEFNSKTQKVLIILFFGYFIPFVCFNLAINSGLDGNRVATFVWVVIAFALFWDVGVLGWARGIKKEWRWHRY